MKTVTLVALTIKGYYSPSLYLLRDYALRDERIRSHYRFRLIDASILFLRKRRLYSLEMFECIMDFFRSVRSRKLVTWIKTQVKYSKHLFNVFPNFLWWWTFFKVLSTHPNIIGFSCYIWNIESTLRMAKWVKRVLPGTTIIFGGQEVTNSAEKFIRKYLYIDFIVDGEGEETFRSVLELLLAQDKKAIKNVPGLMGQFDETYKKRDVINNLELIPLLVENICKDTKMLQKVKRSNLGYMVETSRGCPFKCSFCFESDKFKSVRHFPLNKVAKEIMAMSLLGINRYHILDPVLCNSDSKRLRTLTETIRQAKKNVNIELSVEIYAEFLKEDMLDCFEVFNSFDIGLQSYNPYVLQKINRYFHKDKFKKGIELLKRENKYFAIYLIYGLPGETVYSFLKSMLYVISLKPPRIFINQLCVLRGTPLRNMASKEKIKFNTLSPYHVLSTCDMSSEEVKLCGNLSKSFMKEFTSKVPGIR